MNILAKTLAPKLVREIEGIKEYQLKNGLKILLFADPSQQSVTVNITYLVGSRHEGRGEAGMAHLLEHMLFKGTPTFKDIKGVLQDKGAFFNATTWFDHTNYYETLPASEENLEFALHLESDRMINSFVSQEDLDAEMTVVRNEFEMGENDAMGVLHDQIMSTAFRWHNYGKSTIGNKSDIERVPATTLRKFYQHYYQPNNGVLIVAGKFEEKRCLEFIQEYFGKIKKISMVLDQTYTEEPAQDGARDITVSRSGDVASAAVAYHIPSGSNRDFAAIKVLIDILADEPNGVLYKNLIKTQKATEIYGMAYALCEPSVLMTLVRAKDSTKIGDLKNDLIYEMENLDGAISKEDVHKAKLRLLKTIKLTMSDSKKFALHLSEFISQGDYRLFFLIRDYLKDVKLDDVLGAAKTYLIATNRTSGVFVPEQNSKRAQIAPKPDLIKTFQNYSGSETLVQGEHFDTSAKNIDKHTETLTLSNNIKLAMLHKQTRADTVQARFNFRFSNEDSLCAYVEESNFLPKFLMRGTKSKSYQDIQDELDGLESTLNLSTGIGVISASITSNKKYLGHVVKLLAEILIEPGFDQKEFNLLRQKEIAQIQEELSDPERLGFNALARLKDPWPKISIHYVPTLPEKIERLNSLTGEKLSSFYENNFGASNLEASILGSFDKAKLSSLLEYSFGKFKSPRPYTRVKDTFISINAQKLEVKTPDKQMAIAALSTRIKMRDDDANYPALRIAHYIFSESMKSRLVHRLREKEGLSYGAGGWLVASKFEQSTSASMYAMASSNTAEKALLLMLEEWDLWVKNGVSEQELLEAKASLAAFVANLFANDQFVVGQLVTNLQTNRNFAFYEDLLAKIDALTTKKTNETIANVLKSCKFARVIAGDL